MALKQNLAPVAVANMAVMSYLVYSSGVDLRLAMLAVAAVAIGTACGWAIATWLEEHGYAMAD